MSLESYCTNPACKRRHLLPDTATGKSVRCKGCGQTFVAGASVTMAKSQDVIEPAWNEPAKASNTAPGVASTVGNTVGRFAIRGKLGTGAFGTVYRAYDPQLDRVVALKVPNPGVMTDAKRAERFLREAKAAANLRHPHIVPVFDAGKDGDTYYIASAFIEGQPLADSIPEKGVEFERAARIVRELAEALAYAHEQGIVHRDVKPANIMIDTHDRVHLMDFGLAARQEEAARLTNDGAVMGTPAYMSPEQARGQKGEAQPSTDQYAAGVVLYELLTGRTPFGGPPAVVIANVIAREPDPPRKYRPYIPKDLETICLKAMAKQQEKRYGTCQALADDLRRWLEGEPVTARRLRPWERVVRWVRKEPKLAVAIAVVASVLLLSIALISVAAQRADSSRRNAEKDAESARAAEKRAADALADARAARTREERATVETLGALGTAAEERKKAESLKRALDAERKNNEALTLSLESERKRDEVPAPLLSANVWDAKTDVQSHTFKGHAASVSSVRFSPDGTRIVTGSNDKTAKVWDAKTRTELLTLEGHSGVVYSVAFSPDGTRIVTGSDDTTAKVWDAKTGAELLTLTGHRGGVKSASFSLNGTRIVTASNDYTAKVWDARTGIELFTLRGHRGRVECASFNTDGTRIVTASDDKTARVWGGKAGVEVLILEGHTSPVKSVSFSPDGARIVTGSSDKTAKVWDAKTGTELLTLKGDDVYSVACSPDGLRIVTGGWGLTATVWDAKTGIELLTLKGHRGGVNSVSFSADGARIVTASYDETAKVWEAVPKPSGK